MISKWSNETLRSACLVWGVSHASDGTYYKTTKGWTGLSVVSMVSRRVYWYGSDRGCPEALDLIDISLKRL